MIDFDGRIVADDDDEKDDKDDAKASKKDEKNRAVQKILFDSRTILLFGEINEKVARETCAQLIDSTNPPRVSCSAGRVKKRALRSQRGWPLRTAASTTLPLSPASLNRQSFS